MKKLPENLEFLLDKEWVENFLRENCVRIFKKDGLIEVKDILRSKSYAPEAFNMLYTLNFSGQKFLLRGSASTIAEKETTYKTMKFIFEHGFNIGEYLSPQPLAYIEDLNLMLYKDVPGKMMRDTLGENSLEELIKQTFDAGKALKKFHQLPMPEFLLNSYNLSIDKEKIIKYAPDLEKYLDERLENNMHFAKGETAIFCHGDYQPKNLIISTNFYIIDFGSTLLSAKELDIASFVNQLETMLQRYGNVEFFSKAKENFLKGYGEFDKAKYQIFSYLMRLQIMQALIITYEEDPNIDIKQMLKTIQYWQDKTVDEFRENE